MSVPKILLRYARVFDLIQSCGSASIGEKIVINNLGLSRASIQKGYRALKEENFIGDLHEYVCLVSTQYVLIEWDKQIEKGTASLWVVWKYNRKEFRNMIRLFDREPKHVFESDVFKKFGDEWQFMKLICAFKLAELYPDEFSDDLESIKELLKT